MNKRNKALALSIVSAFAFTLFAGCNGGGSGGGQKPEPERYSHISETDRDVVLSCDGFDVQIRKSTGRFSLEEDIAVSLYSSTTVSPISIVFSDGDTLATDGRISRWEARKETGGEAVLVYYDSLKTAGGTETGIAACVRYFSNGKNYFKMSASFDLTDATLSIDDLGLFDFPLTSSAKEEGVLTAPTWNGGQYWTQPQKNTHFRSGVTLGYPGNSERTLEAGWIDYSCNDGGFGIGLINRHCMTTEFRIKSTTSTVSFPNIQFSPKQLLGEDEDLMLVPGETFCSDEMLFVVHSGDWHKTADCYREEYNAAFEGDRITAQTLSPLAKKAHYIYRAMVGINTGTEEAPSLYSVTFGQVKNSIEYFASENKADLSKMLFWLSGQNERGYAFDVPMMTPILPEAGGDEGLKEFTQYLHGKNASIYHYEHPFAVDPVRLEKEEAGLYATVNPDQAYGRWDACLHTSVCIDNDGMQNFWKQKVLPPIAALEADGIMFDQCPLVQTVCNLEGHNHSLSAYDRLSSHAKALIRLQKLVRENIGEDCYMVSEAGNDILTRNVDILQQCWHHNILWDGDLALTVGQYTHPEHIYQPSTITKLREEDGTLYPYFSALLGAVSGGICCLSDGEAGSLAAEYLRFKKAVDGAPGYPFGFRDDVGLTVASPDLFAKVFVGEKGVTLTYVATYHVKDVEVKIDLDALGFTGAGTRTFSVTANTNVCGFEVINLNETEK